MLAAADSPGLLKLVEQNRDILIRNFPQMAKGFARLEDSIAFTEEKALQWNDRRAARSAEKVISALKRFKEFANR